VAAYAPMVARGVGMMISAGKELYRVNQQELGSADLLDMALRRRGTSYQAHEKEIRQFTGMLEDSGKITREKTQEMLAILLRAYPDLRSAMRQVPW